MLQELWNQFPAGDVDGGQENEGADQGIQFSRGKRQKPTSDP